MGLKVHKFTAQGEIDRLRAKAQSARELAAHFEESDPDKSFEFENEADELEADAVFIESELS